ncbi:MAG: VWA domain-containing protein [Amaricoccus sp.]|uniref:vWA domain-containing protein n=1 Tax=Amaricoccus sp. TaxID=1872485 RepID=UPI0039E5DFE9
MEIARQHDRPEPRECAPPRGSPVSSPASAVCAPGSASSSPTGGARRRCFSPSHWCRWSERSASRSNSSLGYLLRSRLSKSLDAAGLAAGRYALESNAKEVARDYFDANFGQGGDAVVTEFNFSLDDTKHFVTLTARAKTPTYFMRIFGQTEMDVFATTEVERQTNGMELALVLDNTGSMAGTNFNNMQKAALDLIDILFGDEEEVDNVWVSLTPYVASVNIGPSHTSWLNLTDQALTTPSVFGSEGWKGCVMAQAMPYDGDDTPPTVQKLSSYLYPKAIDNNWPPIRSSATYPNETATGPNLACPTAITPLTKSKTTIKAGLNAMKSWRRGGTTSNLGLTWGWRTISPRWRGLWGDADLPLDYSGDNEDFIDKVVVILTDGENVFFDLPYSVSKGVVTSPGDTTTPSDYTAYGRANAAGPVGLAKTSAPAGKSVLDSRMAATCKAMKAEGIRIYSILFASSISTATKSLWETCASSPAMYYLAPTGAELSAAFKAIGGQLANLRIVK